MAKVTSVVVMVLSALLVIVFLAGVVGIWWGQTQLRGIVTELAAVADSGLERVQTAADQVNVAVGNGKVRIDEASAAITAAGAKIEETNLALVAAEQLLDRDLDPALEQATQRVTDLRSTIALIERTLSLAALLPGAEDSKLLALADSIIEKIKTAGQAVADFRATVTATKSQVTAEAVNKLTTPLDRLNEALVGVTGQLTELGQRVDAQQADLLVLRDRVLKGITLAAVVLTLAFLWLILAQVGLFVHAYGVFKRRDPLARWHKGGSGTEVAVPVSQA